MIITAPRSASMDDKREGFVRESIRGHYCAASEEKCQTELAAVAHVRTRTSFNPQICRFKP
jgi:hypothetical protein